MGVSNPTSDVFLPELKGRKLHLHVPQYIFVYLYHGYLENGFILPFFVSHFSFDISLSLCLLVTFSFV